MAQSNSLYHGPHNIKRPPHHMHTCYNHTRHNYINRLSNIHSIHAKKWKRKDMVKIKVKR